MDTPPPKSQMVFQGDRPCALVSFTGRKRDSVLFPEGPVAVFRSRGAAKGAIARSERIARTLRSSLLADWDKLKPLLSGEPYRLVPCAPVR